MARADKALTARRVEEILHIRLDGAQGWNVCEFVREKEKEEGSLWFLAEGEEPLSESQVRRYQQKADALIASSHEKSRKRLVGRHLAQRKNLYGRCVQTGDFRTALSCLRDEAELIGLYPPTKIKAEHTGKDGGPIQITQVEFVQPPALPPEDPAP